MDKAAQYVRPGSAVPASMIPPVGGGTQAAGAPVAPAPVYSPGSYGEAVTVPIIFGAAGALLALDRPTSGIRKLLIINNTIAGFAITVGYDTPPTVASGLQIAAGGNLFFDVVVPQNAIWLFSPAAGTVQLIFMIDNVSQG
jgi:hypothetical protein